MNAYRVRPCKDRSVVGEAIVFLIAAIVMTVAGFFFWAWWNDEDSY